MSDRHIIYSYLTFAFSKNPLRKRRSSPAQVSIIVAVFLSIAACGAFAIEPTLAELQAENARLREQNDALHSANPVHEAAINNSNVVSNVAGIETVVVSGLREAPIQDFKEVAQSISVISGEELNEFKISSIDSILPRLGGVKQSHRTGVQTSSFLLRGVGWTAGTGPLDPSVGVTVDGVSYGLSGLATAIPFFDLESVNATRGTQGTHGGKNYSVGQINIATKKPEFTPDSYASLGYGQYKNISASATATGPLIDDLLAYRISFLKEESDGPWQNVYDPRIGYGALDQTYGRAQLLLTPIENLSARLSLDFSRREEVPDNGFYYNRTPPAFYDSLDAKGQPIPVNASTSSLTRVNRRWFQQEAAYNYDDFVSDKFNRIGERLNFNDVYGGSLVVDWKLGNTEISSITAYRVYDFQSGTATPTTPFDIGRNPGSGRTWYQQISQEFNLVTHFTDSLTLQYGAYADGLRFPERWTSANFGSDAGAWYATQAQYTRLDATASGQLLLRNSADRLIVSSNTNPVKDNAAVFTNLEWKATDALTINTGLRLSREKRESYGDRVILNEGYGTELNPAFINDVWLGGFYNTALGELQSPDFTNDTTQLALADSVAKKYFGAASYGQLTAAQKRQVADAKAVRTSRLGGLSKRAWSEPFEKTLPSGEVSASYKLNEDHTVFAAWKHGEKAGITQILGATVAGGTSFKSNEEKSNSYEIGLKSELLDNSLALSITGFQQDITDYIQDILVYDEALTIANNNGDLAYTQGLGSVPKVQTKGIELDIAYTGIRGLDVRFSGAYIDAKYKDFKYLAKPPELGGTNIAYYDATGKALPGSAKLTGNLYVGYTLPVLQEKAFHVGANYNYTSRFNASTTLSRFSEVDAYGLLDLSIGIGRNDGTADLSLIVSSALDTDTGYATWDTYVVGIPRQIKLQLSGKFN